MTIPRVPGGVHYPKGGTASTSFTFWANYSHAGGAAPDRGDLKRATLRLQVDSTLTDTALTAAARP